MQILCELIFLQLGNFVLATFLHPNFPFGFRLPRYWQAISQGEFSIQKGCQNKICDLQKINCASHLHFFDENFISFFFVDYSAHPAPIWQNYEAAHDGMIKIWSKHWSKTNKWKRNKKNKKDFQNFKSGSKTINFKLQHRVVKSDNFKISNRLGNPISNFKLPDFKVRSKDWRETTKILRMECN